jgi:hypothetical protein
MATMYIGPTAHHEVRHTTSLVEVGQPTSNSGRDTFIKSCKNWLKRLGQLPCAVLGNLYFRIDPLHKDLRLV